MNHQDSYVRSLKIGHTNGAASLRQLAVTADTASTVEVNLALLWRELVNGLCRVADDFFTDERCYVVLKPSFDGPGAIIDGRRLEILQAVLCGQGQKNIAIDLGLAPSTIALNARLALEGLGLRCKPSRVHPLLMLAAKAGSKSGGAQTATLSFVAEGAEQLRVVSVPRPDRRLFRVLPPAELAVIRHLVEGLCYHEIARLRGTSTRTIANQITAVFRRMRASGRNELLSRLFFTEGLEGGSLPPATREAADLRSA
jgi:DNA-binding NarL/FixJ family response regulator